MLISCVDSLERNSVHPLVSPPFLTLNHLLIHVLPFVISVLSDLKQLLSEKISLSCGCTLVLYMAVAVVCLGLRLGLEWDIDVVTSARCSSALTASGESLTSS